MKFALFCWRRGWWRSADRIADGRTSSDARLGPKDTRMSVMKCVQVIRLTVGWRG